MFSVSAQKDFFSQLSKSLRLPKQAFPVTHFSYSGILGTNLNLSIKGTKRAAENASFLALLEIDRLEKVYDQLDESSELKQWLNHEGTLYNVSTDLAHLVHKGLLWTQITKTAFHPGVDALRVLWRNAERRNDLPKQKDLDNVLEYLQADFCFFEAYNMSLDKRFPISLDFTTLSKGMIIDATATHAFKQLDVQSGLLNIGGDLRHIGYGSNEAGILVEVAGSFSASGDADQSLTIHIDNQGVATSSHSQQGFCIQDRCYSGVLDPRTGWPVEDRISATVIAPDCATAMVLATSFSVLKPHESIALADSLTDVGCHLVTQTGAVYSNNFFDRHTAS